MTEAFLHYLWKYRLFEGDLVTTTGLPLTVERSGEHNHDAGPDFIDARITIGDLQWAGNVEIHVKASDWNLHRHSSDKAYNNVILHVVYSNDCDIVTEAGKALPTIEVKDAIPSAIWDGYAALMQPALPVEIPCVLDIPEVPELILHSAMDRMMAERMERKSGDVRRLLEESNSNWETTCYWMVSRYFGGKTNAFAFEMLAKATPQRYLAKIKNNPFRIEALLMGQAGLLEGDFDDDYPKALQKEYLYLRKAYSLEPMEGHLWKFFRLRPNNFPTLRISQLADLIAKSDNLFSHLLETKKADEISSYFNLEASEYWKTHYRFDQESDHHAVSTGKTFADILVINSWAPLLFEYGVQHADQERKDQAMDILQQMKPEKNHIVTLWQKAGIASENAAHSQSLLQLYNEYCKNKHCLDCPIGYHIMVRKNRKRR